MDLSFREFGAMAKACTILLVVFTGMEYRDDTFFPTGTVHSEADPWSEKKKKQ
jgi:hypothetical protein